MDTTAHLVSEKHNWAETSASVGTHDVRNDKVEATTEDEEWEREAEKNKCDQKNLEEGNEGGEDWDGDGDGDGGFDHGWISIGQMIDLFGKDGVNSVGRERRCESPWNAANRPVTSCRSNNSSMQAAATASSGSLPSCLTVGCKCHIDIRWSPIKFTYQ